MKFFHGGDDVRDVFNDVLGAEVIEGIIAEGQAAVIQMAENIGGGGGIHIEADGAGVFRWSTAYVENARQSSSCGRICNQFSVSHECEKGCEKQNSTGLLTRACATCKTIVRQRIAACLHRAFDFCDTAVHGADCEFGLLFVNQERGTKAQRGVAGA
jgi:hypothetical protein